MEGLTREYNKILADYVNEQNERNLYIGQNFVRQMIKRNVTPEEVVGIHNQAVEIIFPEKYQELRVTYDFLIEMMVHYGMALRQHQSLVEKKEELQIELNIAAKVQQTMLKTHTPTTDHLEIGLISTPIKVVNGDYVHFSEYDNYIGVAVTDVVGKGVPAALCMSMVKYGLESMQDDKYLPSHILTVLNRIVEKNVDDTMFISMFYGAYEPNKQLFYYGFAGHEPAFLYKHDEDTFVDLRAKGMLLGVLPNSNYYDESVQLASGDVVIIVTDGVTEFRGNDATDERAVVKSLIKSALHLSAQEMCDYLYRQIEELNDFMLQDDFTVVVIKKY